LTFYQCSGSCIPDAYQIWLIFENMYTGTIYTRSTASIDLHAIRCSPRRPSACRNILFSSSTTYGKFSEIINHRSFPFFNPFVTLTNLVWHFLTCHGMMLLVNATQTQILLRPHGNCASSNGVVV